MIITIITKITTNNNQISNNKKFSIIYPKIFVLKTYQSYKNTNVQLNGNKTAGHFLQY